MVLAFSLPKGVQSTDHADGNSDACWCTELVSPSKVASSKDMVGRLEDIVNTATALPSARALHPAVEELNKLIEGNEVLFAGFQAMFKEQKGSPLHLVSDYNDLLAVLDRIIGEAPLFSDLGLPIYMAMRQLANTRSGYSTFLNAELNAQFKRILEVWSTFLVSPLSCHVLTSEEGGWFSTVALSALEADFDGLTFAQIYECHPDAPHFGFSSWDTFFNRTFRQGVRAVERPNEPNVISAACESRLYNISYDVQERDPFWIKGETYSLVDMLDYDELTSHFVGGTVLQGYLQSTGYHRWNSPCTGTVRKIVLVPGVYFCQAPTTISEENDPYLRSQMFLSAITTRMLIFIESDNPIIALMCFIAIGMTEVSSCEATVKEGQRVERGEELGMFHFGGSSHVLLFRKETRVVFEEGCNRPGDLVRLRAAIGRVGGEPGRAPSM